MRLSVLRRALAIPQWELAHRLRLNPATFSLLETGRRKPSAQQAKIIAIGLGLKIEDVFPEVGNGK